MLPFYKTFPFMDYYKNEEAFAKDLRMIKDMYPLDTATTEIYTRLFVGSVRCV